MEFSIKTFGLMVEPIVAVVFPFVFFGVDLNGFFLASTLSVEEKVRVWMAIMFAIYYMLKIIKFYEQRSTIDLINNRIAALEKKLGNGDDLDGVNNTER